jgi:hypothetical protein
VAEGARLESVYALIRIEGSNPSLSAIQVIKINQLVSYSQTCQFAQLLIRLR